MAIKKSEIYSQIWAACDKLRGGVEPARYKDYILTLLFVKYVSASRAAITGTLKYRKAVVLTILLR